jgi:hypothetical protein
MKEIIETKVPLFEHDVRETYWFYDCENEILVDLKNGEVTKVSNDSPNIKILKLLNNSITQLSASVIFESTWKIKYSEEKHLPLLKVTIGRIKKINRSIEIICNNKTYVLLKKGLIL